MTPRSSCNTGDVGEAILLTELIMRDISVAIPFGHNDPYDLVVIRKDGKCLKVQVKTSKGRGNDRFQFNCVKNCDKVDVFGFLMLDQWHFMASSQVKRKIRANEMLYLNKSKVSLNNFELLC